MPLASSKVNSARLQSRSSGRKRSHLPPSTSATTTFLARLFDSWLATSRGVVTPRTAGRLLPSGSVSVISSLRSFAAATCRAAQADVAGTDACSG